MRTSSIFASLLLLLFLQPYNSEAQEKSTFLLLEGFASYRDNHRADQRDYPATVISGQNIPAIDYQLQQYTRKMIFAPAVHYFFDERWSVGLSLYFQKTLTQRSVPNFQLHEESDFVAFPVPALTKETSLFSQPNITVGRHWKIYQRFIISLQSFVAWQWLRLQSSSSPRLDFSPVANLEDWKPSPDGLSFKAVNPPLENTGGYIDQSWILGFYPQLRYYITARFGLTAKEGAFQLSQKIKSDRDDFLKAKPNWTLELNPETWRFGLFVLFRGG